MWKTLLLIIAIANVLGFLMIGLDKWKAKTGRWRISEFALVIPSIFGGWIGTLLAMKWVRHKTQKRSFQVKLGLAILLSIALAYAWWTQPR